MIPKKIHYCWFGGNPLPEMAQRCIASWKKYCPDYEIIEWNESNFDLNCCEYVKQAYEAKKWAFVSDVARLYALVNYGGIYMDTDVEVIKPLDDILECEAVSGFERVDAIPTGLMGCEAQNRMFREFLEEYNTAQFIKEDGSLDITTNVTRITDACLKYGLVLNNEKQTVNTFTLFPKDYFCPKDPITKQLKITENTYTIHHFDGSWLAPEDRLTTQYHSQLLKIKFMPFKLSGYIARGAATLKIQGISGLMSRTMKVLKRRMK